MTKQARSSIQSGAIDRAKQLLKQAPIKEKQNISLRQVIGEMQQEIEEVLQKGYTCDEVATLLAQSEIEIQGSTLKQYLSQARRTCSEKRSKSSRTVSRSNEKLKKNKNQNSDVEVQERDLVAPLEHEISLLKNTEEIQDALDRNIARNFVEMPEEL